MYLGEVDMFYEEVRPNLTESQQQLVSAFAKARSYKKSDELLTAAEVKEAAESIIYDTDFAKYVIKSADDYRLKQVIKRMKVPNDR